MQDRGNSSQPGGPSTEGPADTYMFAVASRQTVRLTLEVQRNCTSLATASEQVYCCRSRFH